MHEAPLPEDALEAIKRVAAMGVEYLQPLHGWRSFRFTKYPVLRPIGSGSVLGPGPIDILLSQTELVWAKRKKKDSGKAKRDQSDNWDKLDAVFLVSSTKDMV
ncbi:MAG: hypothetical protein JRH19_28740, partial [Deltaproteobacteria bacterium]|nr:hypothetical protein [Deltaproteobacteria bacterium]